MRKIVDSKARPQQRSPKRQAESAEIDIFAAMSANYALEGFCEFHRPRQAAANLFFVSVHEAEVADTPCLARNLHDAPWALQEPMRRRAWGLGEMRLRRNGVKTASSSTGQLALQVTSASS